MERRYTTFEKQLLHLPLNSTIEILVNCNDESFSILNANNLLNILDISTKVHYDLKEFNAKVVAKRLTTDVWYIELLKNSYNPVLSA